MKRSQINKLIEECKGMLQECGFALPAFAFWSIEDWRAHAQHIDTIKKTMLGWDITDFGTNDFYNTGAVLFTIRNGTVGPDGPGTPYAEKIIFCKDGQKLPLHFHFSKTEDIINRGGGILTMQLYNANSDYSVDYKSDVEVYCDGIRCIKKAGEPFDVLKGQSVTLKPMMYHLFGAKRGCGDLLAGEVSSVNDDETDNYFAEPISRFADIEEDEAPIHPLCNEYCKIL